MSHDPSEMICLYADFLIINAKKVLLPFKSLEQARFNTLSKILLLLFSKDTLNSLKVTVKTFIMSQNISISNK